MSRGKKTPLSVGVPVIFGHPASVSVPCIFAFSMSKSRSVLQLDSEVAGFLSSVDIGPAVLGQWKAPLYLFAEMVMSLGTVAVVLAPTLIFTVNIAFNESVVGLS